MWLWVWMLLLSATAASAGTDDDAAALSLPSDMGAPVTGRATSFTVEGAEMGAAGAAVQLQRVSVDGRFDGSVGSGWRAVLAERLDAEWQEAPVANQQVATLKEAYVGWQPRLDLLVDIGRINARQGVALGYNPSDFLRTDAIRSVVSIDPNSLRENRLGTAMLRGETLWSGGALTALYAPRLSEHPSAGAFDPDFGATNARGRWLVSLSQSLAPGWMPQWLVYGSDGRPPQAGMNWTAVVGSAVVAYTEVSVGRSVSLLAQSGVAVPYEPQTLRSRVAAGLTYSLPNKLSLTLEYEYNGAGLSAGRWSALRAGAARVYGYYRDFASSQQDLPTQSNVFVYAAWQDLVVRHVDLSAFVRIDAIDHSRLAWLELRRHWAAVDLALRWQDSHGGYTTDFGAASPRQTWQLLLDYYL